MALDPSIPLAAVQKRNSLTDRYMQGMQVQAAQQQMQAQQAQMQREEARRNALKGAYGPEGLDYAKAEQALMESGDIESALGIRGQRFQEEKASADSMRLKMKAAMEQVDAISRIAGSATDQSSWDAALRRLQSIGADVSSLPPVFSPQTVEQVLQQGLDAKSKLTMAMDREKFDETKRHNMETEKTARNKGEPLVEIFSPDSPTGTKFVPRSQAAGMPGKPPSNGITVTTDENGNPVIQVGGRGGGMTSSTTTQVEKDTIKQGALLSQLNEIDAQFRPEYFTIGGRVGNAIKGGKAMINPALLSPEEQQQYGDFRTFKADTARTQAQVINDLYGAALSGGEAKRADQFLVTEDDDAITAQRKIKGYREFITKAMAKNAYILKNGLSVDAVDVDQMPKIMRMRGDQIAKEVGATGISGDELKAEVKRRLASEFGLAGS